MAEVDAKTRQNSILELLGTHSRATVEELTGRFDVTRQTIRADLRELDDRGLLRRTHGGAIRVNTVANREYASRRKLHHHEKAAMGQLAASLIPDNCSVAMNIGTSTEQVARAMYKHKGLTVLSNNINIINMLINTSDKKLILVGGTVRQSDGAIVGDDAVNFITRYKVDYAVIGASSLDEDGAVLDFDVREVSVARAILANSRTKILVCDSSKFATNAPVRICDVTELHYVVTDRPPPPVFAQKARAGATKILVIKD